MIGALVVLIAAVTALVLLVAYCRTLVASSSSVELSEHARRAMGVEEGITSADEFDRLQALTQLCPPRGNDATPLAAIRTYYHVLNALQTLSSPLFHSLAAWTEPERRRCSYFVAVTLDRRIAHTRKLWSEQMIKPKA